MKVIGLDGKTHIWTPRHTTSHTKHSKLHLKARYLLKKIWPNHVILEEVHLAGTSLFADFIIFGAKIVIEVHGEQHYGFNTLFHSSKADFVAQQSRDSDKATWCELNGFELIILPHWETEDEWHNRICTKETRKIPGITE